jgi:glycosyltransferase involved in cell wall biosynthesis
MDELVLHVSDRIVIPGFKQNVYDYLRTADYYISASDVEGLANTILESMTVGLPMVLSDIPSHHEVLHHTTEMTGFIFDQKSIEDLKDKIIKVLSLETKTVSEALHKTFETYYTAKGMSEKYQISYEKLLNID